MHSRVLFVDDDVLNQWLMTESLKSEGFIVTGVCRGAEALRMLNDGYEFDLLLTDFVMPDGMSGFELAAHWRRVQPGRPIIYTGADPLLAIGVLKSDEGFVRKHADAPDLLDVVDRLLHETRLSMLPEPPRRPPYRH
jgi:CheY-like chemotaxis protein